MDVELILKNSGIYYLELYNSYYYSEYGNNKGSFIPVLVNRLIDIIDFSKKEYKNEKNIKLLRKLSPNYYIVTNLKKDKTVEFTYNVKKDSIYDDLDNLENPFMVCNNNTNECIDNIISYNFTEGNNYTIYINYIYLGYRYCYPSFNLKTIDDGNDEENEDENDNEDDDDISTTTLIAIICGSSLGLIILIIVLFFIIRYFKKKNQNVDFVKETNDINQETLLRTE